MPTDDFADRVTGVASLAEPVRRELYLFVVAQPEPVSRDQAAAGTGVARHTASSSTRAFSRPSTAASPAGRARARAGRPSSTAGSRARSPCHFRSGATTSPGI